jgi:aarF domain-containing kinase
VVVAPSAAPGGADVAAASVSLDEEQVNRLLIEIVRVSDGYGLKLPREFGLLVKQLIYFDRYTRLLAPDLQVLNDERVNLPRSGGGGGSYAYDGPAGGGAAFS